MRFAKMLEVMDPVPLVGSYSFSTVKGAYVTLLSDREKWKPVNALYDPGPPPEPKPDPDAPSPLKIDEHGEPVPFGLRGRTVVVQETVEEVILETSEPADLRVPQLPEDETVKTAKQPELHRSDAPGPRTFDATGSLSSTVPPAASMGEKTVEVVSATHEHWPKVSSEAPSEFAGGRPAGDSALAATSRSAQSTSAESADLEGLSYAREERAPAGVSPQPESAQQNKTHVNPMAGGDLPEQSSGTLVETQTVVKSNSEAADGRLDTSRIQQQGDTSNASRKPSQTHPEALAA